MKVLVIGNGGREHALAWKAAQSPQVDTVFVAPGNAGTALEPTLQNVAIGVTDIPALLSFAQKEKIDLTIVASLMSVIGYSLNDSIVVSDRIRENFRKIRRGTPYEIFNVSLTQTLHRTLITSGTTLMVILMLFLFGGPVLEGFSLTMLIGVSIGTASSICVASALALKLGMKREHMLQQKVEKEGADQPSILP